MDRRNMQNGKQSAEDMLSYLTAEGEQSAPAQERSNQSLANLDRAIQVEESNLAVLRQKYRDTYPDIKQQLARINSLKAQRDQEAEKQAEQQQQQAANADAASQTPNLRLSATLQQQKDRIKSIQTNMDNLDTQVERTLANKSVLAKRAEDVRAKIEASPQIEQQYSALTQDQLLAKSTYDDLARKEKESETAQDIQERHVGEQLEVLDPALLPSNAVEPNRLVIAGVGIGMGLMLGLVLAGAREAKDTSLKNLKDVRAYTNLPVLSSIPLLENALLVRRKRRLFWLAWTTAIIVGSVAMFVATTYYFDVASKGQ
jgi:uncharacterized protein involved in exopolysaccharide biosynthesis